ncbi:MAG: hypothetical protein OXH37_07845, partial [Gammaproteobacteria bacterium]|nr:hypothetical protein [Gammaproteobacteria bacterium]
GRRIGQRHPDADDAQQSHAMDGGIPLSESFRGTIPFLLSGFALLAIILWLPGVCLWLARLA